VTGATGPSGSQGQPGPIGAPGQTGASGPAGSNGTPIAVFAGAYWEPAVAADDLRVLQGSRVLDFGQVPFPSGYYLFSLKMQIGWNAGAVGPNDLTGWVSFFDGPIDRKDLNWGRIKGESAGYQYGVAQSLDFWIIVEVTQGQNLYLKATDQFYLLGAQLVVFPMPTNVISSPGFIA
jgi:hypothetical protein